MKNEELLDLITELKIDDRFIEEAISDDLDGRSPVKAYAGNAKRSPMRIIAPVAACLAVIVGAGFVLANVNGAKKAPIAPADVSASASDESSPAGTDEDFIERCKDIISGENQLLAQSAATWQTSRLDVDLDGEDEYLVYPQTDGKTVKDIGVRVFKKVNDNDIRDLGAFGKNTDTLELSKVYINKEAAQPYVYYFSEHLDMENYELSYSMFKLGSDADGRVAEIEYIRNMQTYNGIEYIDGIYCNGVLVDDDRGAELMDEWLSVPNTQHHLVSLAHYVCLAPIQLLIDKYNVPISDPTELFATGRSGVDVDGDGLYEHYIELLMSDPMISGFCKELPGIYVFATDLRTPTLIGELDLEGERGYFDDTVNYRRCDEIRCYENGDEKFYYFLTYTNANYDGKLADDWERAVNKIVSTPDGTVTSEKILAEGEEVLDDGTTHKFCRINGIDVSEEEFLPEWNKYDHEPVNK